MASTTTVTVVVVTYDSAPLLPGLVSALSDGLADVGHELVFVDNASADDTCDVVRRLAPTATLVALDRNKGYAAGINAGIAAASPDADAVIVMNPDVRPSRRCVEHLLGALGRDGVGIAVPRLLDADGHLSCSLRRRPTVGRAFGEALLGGTRAGRHPLLGEVVTDVAAYEEPTTADWATGAIMAISQGCLAAVGAWNEDFFLYSEETEFCGRASARGFATRLVPEAEAQHIGGEMGTSPRLWAMQVCNRVRLYERGHGRAATALFRVGVGVNEALRAARGSDVHRAGLLALLAPSRRPVEVAHPLEPPLAGEMTTPPSPPAYVCFSAQDWWYHNRAHSDMQLMTHIAESRRVLFVNSIAMRMPLPGRSTQAGRRVWRKAKSMAKLVRQPEAALPDFSVMTPVTLPLYGSARARRISAAIVRLQVRLVTLALRMRSPVYVVTIPTAYDVVAPLPRRRLFYNRSDLHSSFPEADGDLVRSLEESLLSESDAVLYVSRALRDAERDRVGGQAFFLDHGVDVDHFTRVAEPEVPADLRAIPHPRLGFFGGLDDYVVDFDLVEALARALPDANVVLIGDATCSMRRFDAHPNVHWLGHRPYAEIPRYGSGFDVALMPWLDNEWIEHCNPIKLKEYLALGLPIVSTDFPEVHHYADVVRIGRDHDSFVNEVEKALLDRTSGAARRQAIVGATWNQRALDLIALAEGDTQDRGS